MQRRHLDQLMLRLDELRRNGTAYICYQELYDWNAAQRLTKGVWRELKTRWEELLEERSMTYVDPKILRTEYGISLFLPEGAEELSNLTE